jgi:hypothetical protein
VAAWIALECAKSGSEAEPLELRVGHVRNDVRHGGRPVAVVVAGYSALRGRLSYVSCANSGYVAWATRSLRMRSPQQPPQPIAYSVDAAVAATGNAISRSRLYELIKGGEIESRKVGRRRVVLADSLRRYVATAPRS